MSNEQKLASALIKVIEYISSNVDPSAAQVLDGDLGFLYELAYPTKDES